MQLFEQLASPREFQTFNIHFLTFWLVPLCVPFLLSLSRQKEPGFWVALCKNRRVVTACTLFHAGKQRRLQVFGEAICSSWGGKTGLRTESFLATPLPAGKTTEEAELKRFLQNCLYPSHLVLSSDGELPEMSQKFRRKGCQGPLQRGVGDLHFPGEPWKACMGPSREARAAAQVWAAWVGREGLPQVNREKRGCNIWSSIWSLQSKAKLYSWNHRTKHTATFSPNFGWYQTGMK